MESAVPKGGDHRVHTMQSPPVIVVTLTTLIACT
jgi:hypothetical protein